MQNLLFQSVHTSTFACVPSSRNMIADRYECLLTT